MVLRQPIKRQPVVFSEYERVRFLRQFPESYSNGVKLKVQQISAYFDILYSRKTKNFGYASLSVPRHKDITDSKNWKTFYTLYMFLNEFKFEYKLFLESVFDAYKLKPRLPYPNMVYSDFTLSYFAKYKADRKELLQETTSKQVAKDVNLTKIDSILSDIKQDVIAVRDYLIYSDKRKLQLELERNRELIRNPNKTPRACPKAWSSPELNKLNYMINNYTNFSPWYMASIPAVREFILSTNKYGNGDWYDTFRTIFKHLAILNSLRSKIEGIEKSYDVPSTWVSSEELTELINDVVGGANG